jgi:hypothetical protein
MPSVPAWLPDYHLLPSLSLFVRSVVTEASASATVDLLKD